MSTCRCEPHASGTNRCPFCQAAERIESPLVSAVNLISQIAEAPGKRSGGPAPHVLCDQWLEAHGYVCPTSRARARVLRAAELDAEIERLRAERAKL
jgi:hypothetical protein